MVFRRKITKKQFQIYLSLLKRCKKALTILALFGLLWQYVPTRNIQAAIDDARKEEIRQQSILEDTEFDSSKVPLDYEVLTKRTKNSKTFKKIDGSFEVALYDETVHFQDDDGKWKEIDNSIVETKDDSYENVSNHYKIKLPKKISKKHGIKLAVDGYQINWRLLNGNSSSLKHQQEEKSDSKDKTEIKNLNKTVRYSNVQYMTDLEYVLKGDRIKENIYLNQYVSEYSIDFEYTVKGLSIIESEGEIQFVNSNGEVMYKFDDLFMKDQAGEVSFDVKYSLKQTGKKTYVVSITPDNDWLKNAMYPVVIDPTISLDTDLSTFVDTFVVDGNTANRSEDDYVKVGMARPHLYSINKTRHVGLVRFTLPEESKGKYINYAYMMFKAKKFVSGSNVALYENYDSFNYETVNYVTRPSCATKPTDYLEKNYIDDYYTFDITEPMQKWSRSNLENVPGFTLKHKGDSNEIVEFYSRNNDEVSKKPIVIYGYLEAEGLKDYWTYNSYGVPKAGTAYVGDLTGNLTFMDKGVTFQTDLQTLSSNLVYDVNRRSENVGYGKGWNSNFNMKYSFNAAGHFYEVTDATGNVTHYHLGDNDICPEEYEGDFCYEDESGSKDLFIVDMMGSSIDKKLILKEDGTIFNFPTSPLESEGYLESIVDGKSKQKLSISRNTSHEDKINRITDDVGNYIEYRYSNYGNLMYMDLYTKKADGTFHKLTSRFYNVDTLNKLTYSITSNNYNNSGLRTDSTVHYLYDSQSSHLEAVYNNHYEKIQFEYDNENRVMSVESLKMVNGIYTDMGKAIYDYSLGRTKITNHKGDFVQYYFDDFGHTVSTLNNEGYASFKEYSYLIEKTQTESSGSIEFKPNWSLNHKITRSLSGYNVKHYPVDDPSLDYDSVVKDMTGTRENMIRNASFETNSFSNWSFSDDNVKDVSIPTFVSENASLLGSESLRFKNNDFSNQTAVYNVDNIDFSEYINNTLQLSAIAYLQYSTPTNSNVKGDYRSSGLFEITLDFLDSDVQYGSDTYYENLLGRSVLKFDSEVEGIQSRLGEVSVPEGTGALKIIINYKGIGEVYFDNLHLTKGRSMKHYSYDDVGNLTFVSNPDGSYVKYSKVSDIDLSLSKSIKFYDENGNLTNTLTSDDIDNGLTGDFHYNDLDFNVLYNEFGQIISTSVGSGASRYTTSTAYEGYYSQYQTSSTNEYGYSTHYSYNDFSGLLESIRNADTNETALEYTSDGKLQKVIENDYCIGDVCSNVTYEYNDNDQLTKILITENYYYLIEYDEYNRMEKVKVVNDTSLNDPFIQELMSYEYEETTNGTHYKDLLSSQLYGNGDAIKFEYNSDDLIESVFMKQGGMINSDYKKRFSYIYDEQKRLIKTESYKDKVIVDYEIIEYNSEGQVSSVSDKHNNVISYIYDDFGNLEKMHFNINNEEYETHFTREEYNYETVHYLDSSEIVPFTFTNGQMGSGSSIITQSPSQNSTTIQLEYSDEYVKLGGDLSVQPDTEYSFDIDISELNGEIRFMFLEFDGNGNYLNNSYTNIINTNGNYSHQFTTGENTRKLIVTPVKFSSLGCTLSFTNVSLTINVGQAINQHDKTSYTSINDRAVTKDYSYEEEGFKRLNQIHLTNEVFTADKSYSYYDSTSRINEVSYQFGIVGSTIPTEKLTYHYSYDALGNITVIDTTSEVYNGSSYDVTHYKVTYDYDAMNQLRYEEVNNYTSDCDVVSETCYIKTYEYDTRGNIVKINTFVQSTGLFADPVIPQEYEESTGRVDVYVETNGATVISPNQPLNLDFSYYTSGGQQVNLLTSCNYVSVDTSQAGYYLLECDAQMAMMYKVSFGILITVGTPIGEERSPEKVREFVYDDKWLDQLNYIHDITYDSQGTPHITEVQNYATYDEQGNPTEITNFEFNGDTYDLAEFEYFGRQLEKITLSDSALPTKVISYEYNDQGYRTSKTVDGVTTTYVLSGDKVVFESSDEYDLFYTYDYDGTLISFGYLDNVGEGNENGEYFYVTNLQGDITRILNENGDTVVQYTYDAWGNILSITGSLASTIGKINPYTYRGYRYDTEISMYYLNSRYYSPTMHRFLNADGLLGEQGNILGHNMFAYCQNNPVMLTDSTGYAPWWNWAISGAQLVGGIALCFVPGAQGIGISLIIGGTLGLIANAASPAIGQAIGGASSMVNGYGAISTGSSILGLGLPGLIGGIALIGVGTATMAFGANEIAGSITGNNYIQSWTGMSDTAYGWTYTGLNIASSVGQVAGRAYNLHNTRVARFGHTGNLKGYHYYDQRGNILFDFDYPHGNINYNHFHGWSGPGMTGRTGGHWSYIELIQWLLGGK